MATHTGSFTLGAWIVGTRWKHHRLHDHFGAESDEFLMLSRRIGPYEEQTPVHAVLEDLIARIYSLETTTKVRGSFTLDAVINLNSFRLNAVIFRSYSSTFTLDAWVTRGSRFTLDAVIRGGGTFSLNAFIV